MREGVVLPVVFAVLFLVSMGMWFMQYQDANAKAKEVKDLKTANSTEKAKYLSLIHI